jgi:A/G-specific adenine glycosylase
MSIVHGERVVALDGNIERVLSRLDAYGKNPKTAAGKRFLARVAEPWLDAVRPGDSNQALMELGATVCLPRNPRCPSCPIVEYCRAKGLQRVDSYPWRPRTPRIEKRRLLTVCVRQRDRLLLFRRDSESGLLAGTWELPWIDSDSADPCKALSGRYGGKWKLGECLGSIRHTITNRNLTVTLCEGEHESQETVAERREARWANLEELDGLPHSSLVRKVCLAASKKDRRGD